MNRTGTAESDERVFDVHEVARAWGIAVVTARRWARDGLLPGTIRTPTGQLRFTSAALPSGGQAA